ncbi:MAG: divergent polysaccharide deacetylase family protein [Halioglobus sp.]|nr:divergent polysaccharide deacetylase family protein [Halioglobus sp.]
MVGWLATVAAVLFTLGASADDEAFTRHCANPLPERDRDTLVIIIDDVGNNLSRGRAAVRLPGKLTYAVIPFTPYAQQLAQAADDAGKEVMVHAPMSAVENLPLGRGALTGELSHDAFLTALRDALDSLPQARGLNNHMGSELTRQRLQMAWLMQELRARDLYFVDSRTSDETVAATVAAEFRVPHLSRQVFLDNERSLEAIDARFRDALALLHETGLAVAIGHPYPETLEYLRAALPLLTQAGIDLAFVSEVASPASAVSACAETVEKVKAAARAAAG